MNETFLYSFSMCFEISFIPSTVFDLGYKAGNMRDKVPGLKSLLSTGWPKFSNIGNVILFTYYNVVAIDHF